MITAASIKHIPLTRPTLGLSEERAVVGVLRSGWVSQGPLVGEFERNFAEYVGARHAVAVSSCTAALHLALVVAGVGSGDEVLCPSLSFIATANAIVHAGAVPVFVDIDQATYNIDPGRIESAITPQTRAILVVHQVGLPAAIAEISEIASRHGLLIVEDAACAVGAEYKGQRIGLPHTAMACFSFHPRKIMTTGEGGMITTASEELADRLRRLRQHAMTVSDVVRHNSTQVVVERYSEIGYNYRMTDLQSAVGLVQLRRLDEMLAVRRALAGQYTSGLCRIPWLVLPQSTPASRHNYQSYVVRLQHDAPVDRDTFMQILLDRGISTRRGIMAIHRESPYSSEKWVKRLPTTALVSDTTCVLPLFHDMTQEEHAYVLQCIRDIDRRS